MNTARTYARVRGAMALRASLAIRGKAIPCDLAEINPRLFPALRTIRLNCPGDTGLLQLLFSTSGPLGEVSSVALFRRVR